MQQLLLRGFILLSLLALAIVLAACGGTAGGVPTNTATSATSVPAVTEPTSTSVPIPPTDTAIAPTDIAVPPTQAMTETETSGGSTTPPAGIADHVLTNADNNTSVTLKVDGTLLVELSDRQWSTPTVDSSILGIAPLNITLPQGAQAWKYNALAPGQTDLTSEGRCHPNPGGLTCNSVLVYNVTITIMAAGQ